MAEESHKSLEAGPEQVLYARILEIGMYFGLLLLIITYVLYIFGFITPYIERPDVPLYWGFTVDEYLAKTGIHAGWSWVGMLKYGDFLNFVPIAFLAAITIICFIAIVPTLFSKGDTVYGILAIAEAVILTVAASGILGSGGH